MRRRKGTRIYGPYRRGNAWIVRVLEEDGGGSDRSCESEAEAEKFIDDTRRTLRLEGPITVDAALEEYEGHIRAKGNKLGTVATTMRRLRRLVGGGQARLVEAARGAGEAYAAYASRGSGHADEARPRAVDTHRNALGEARTFGRWAAKKGYLRKNPWAEVEAVGKRKKGKAKLRVDEARTFLAKCVELDNAGAVSAMCGLLLGFGASEIVERVGRDVDDGGAILWMDEGKTDNRERHVEVPLLPAPLEPEWLRRKLAELAAAAGPAGWLFSTANKRSKLPRRSRHWALAQVKRICKLAGVKVITAHGLRGTQGTIAASDGVVPQVVANALGNTEAVARGHYIQPGAEQTGRSKRALQVLAGGRK